MIDYNQFNEEKCISKTVVNEITEINNSKNKAKYFNSIL